MQRISQMQLAVTSGAKYYKKILLDQVRFKSVSFGWRVFDDVAALLLLGLGRDLVRVEAAADRVVVVGRHRRKGRRRGNLLEKKNEPGSTRQIFLFLLRYQSAHLILSINIVVHYDLSYQQGFAGIRTHVSRVAP